MIAENPLLVHEHESARRLSGEEQHLVQLVPHALRRHALEQRAVPPHERARLVLDGEVEPRHELNAPQNPQRILEKRILAVDPEKPPLEIRLSAERIDERAASRDGTPSN